MPTLTPDPFAQLAPGIAVERSRTITDACIQLFAEATGDFNPIHLDEETGHRSMFGSRIAHGMLSAGFISAAIAMELPGPGSIYLSQTLRFVKPVRIGDVITTRIEVLELVPERRRVKLATSCRNQRDEVVLDGDATIQVPAIAG
jgi:3-hydroxybutyryl-CoA dehydratase